MQRKFKTKTNKVRKGVVKSFPSGTGKSTGHKAYRSSTGDLMEGFYDADLGSGNKKYINDMSEGY